MAYYSAPPNHGLEPDWRPARLDRKKDQEYHRLESESVLPCDPRRKSYEQNDLEAMPHHELTVAAHGVCAKRHILKNLGGQNPDEPYWKSTKSRENPH